MNTMLENEKWKRYFLGSLELKQNNDTPILLKSNLQVT
jgi:hypothetical protein